MKKLLIVLLALTVLGVFAFAQDAAPTLVWGGSVNSGFAEVSNSAASTNVGQYYDYNSESGGRIRLQGAINAADGNSGFQFRVQNDGLGATAPVLNQAWAYGKFLDGMVKVEAGKLNNYAFSTGDWACFGDHDGGLGALLSVTPMEGVAIGAYLPMPTGGTGYTSGTLQFAYTMKDVFTLVGGYTLSPLTTNTGDIYAGVVLKAIPNLAFDAELQLTKLADSAPVLSGTTTIVEHAAYTMGAMTASIYAAQWMYAAASSNLYYNFEPQVAYKVADPVTVALIGNVYTYNQGASGWNFLSPTDGISALTSIAGGSPVLAFGAGPNVQLSVGGFKVTIGDYYGIIPAFAGAATTNINVFYTGFAYSF